jgi:hypothetical protein
MINFKSSFAIYTLKGLHCSMGWLTLGSSVFLILVRKVVVEVFHQNEGLSQEKERRGDLTQKRDKEKRMFLHGKYTDCL